MLEVSDHTIPIEVRLKELEKTTGFSIVEMPFADWRSQVLAMEASSDLNWPTNNSTGYIKDQPRYTKYATKCRGGVAFKQIDGMFVPNIFHFDLDETVASINAALEADSRSIVGLFGTVADTKIQTTAHLQQLGLLPLIRTEPHTFNILADPNKKFIAYSFGSTKEVMQAIGM